MTNLFSVFDPNTTLYYPLNWVSIMLGLFFIPQPYWLLKNRLIVGWRSLSTYLHQEFLAVLTPASQPGLTWVMTSLLFFIMFNNFLGLLPYVFTASSHLVFALTLALPLWLGFTVYSWIFQPISTLAHLTPTGTPYALMPFMVLIELVSSLIRPGTLTVRLAANMVAGHLLMTLLGNVASSLSLILLSCLLSGLIMLMILESAVALIQSYVFSTLMTLYIEEVNSNKFNRSLLYNKNIFFLSAFCF